MSYCTVEGAATHLTIGTTKSASFALRGLSCRKRSKQKCMRPDIT